MIFTPAMMEAPEDKSASIKCLAMNMYHEARGQGSAGLLGVSSVVMIFGTLYGACIVF